MQQNLKVLMLNGSPRANGNTSVALKEMEQVFKDNGIETEIERICFPPNEACSKKHMKDRVAGIADLFLVAIDKENGKMAGFLNGLATDEVVLKDEFFTDAGLHNPEGKNIMLLGLDVLPEYRSQGLARELVRRYLEREWGRGRKEIILTCLESKVAMYEKFGFKDKGIAQSTWGGEEWHEMGVKNQN